MIHFDKVREGRWTCIIFIPQFRGFYCLSFHLKHEGMNYKFADNFKFSSIICDINVFVKRASNIHVYLKKHLGGCRDRLCLTYKDL